MFFWDIEWFVYLLGVMRKRFTQSILAIRSIDLLAVATNLTELRRRLGLWDEWGSANT